MNTINDPVLGLAADMLDDLETQRIATDNRVRILTTTEPDDDGVHRGHGLPTEHPDVQAAQTIADGVAQLEADAVRNLEKAMRKNPLGPFVKNTPGLGLKQTARLLAAVGDPFWNDLYNRPRTVSELWAYCGCHVVEAPRSVHGRIATQARSATPGPRVAPKRMRGQTSNWNEEARKRVWVIASAIPKFKTSPYEPVYRSYKASKEGSLHPAECVRCGPSGHPAPAGSERSAGHVNAMAHRYVAKRILRDLWCAAKEVHEQ